VSAAAAPAPGPAPGPASIVGAADEAPVPAPGDAFDALLSRERSAVEAPAATGRLLMIGCGNMGGAMLSRWLETGTDPASVTVVSPSGRAMPDGVEVVREIPAPGGGRGFDTVLLAVKPQKLPELADTHLGAHAPRLLVSILAGVEEPVLARLCGAGAVVRAMPNLPVRLGRGVVALSARSAGPEARAAAEALMRPLGLVEWIGDEALFDAATALGGSGPAFLYRFADALAAGGAALGLPREQADRIALAAVEGAAMLAAGSGEAPAALAERVASRGGSTRAGLEVLDRDRALERLVADTLAAAERRNREMAADARAGGAPPGNRETPAAL